MPNAADVSIEIDRIPSPLPLYRAPAGSHPYNTFIDKEHRGTTAEISATATVQQNRAKELEELLGSLWSEDAKTPPFQQGSLTSSSLLDDDWSDSPISPAAFHDFSAMDLALLNESFAPAKDAAVLDTALTSRIESAGRCEDHGFSIQAAMRLKDKVIELFQMTEISSAMSGDTKSPRAGSIINTPHGLAMLLIPQQQTVKTDPQKGKTSPSKHKRWTPEEDNLLTFAVQNQRGNTKLLPWVTIAATYFAGNRSGKQVSDDHSSSTKMVHVAHIELTFIVQTSMGLNKGQCIVFQQGRRRHDIGGEISRCNLLRD